MVLAAVQLLGSGPLMPTTGATKQSLKEREWHTTGPPHTAGPPHTPDPPHTPGPPHTPDPPHTPGPPYTTDPPHITGPPHNPGMQQNTLNLSSNYPSSQKSGLPTSPMHAFGSPDRNSSCLLTDVDRVSHTGLILSYIHRLSHELLILSGFYPKLLCR